MITPTPDHTTITNAVLGPVSTLYGFGYVKGCGIKGLSYGDGFGFGHGFSDGGGWGVGIPGSNNRLLNYVQEYPYVP